MLSFFVALLMTDPRSDVLERLLLDLGMAKLAELGPFDAAPSAEPSPFIPAHGPCTRPSEARMETLRKTIGAWIGRRVAEQHTVVLDFGCEQPDGLIVDVMADVLRKKGDERLTGLSWVLRVRGMRIEALADEVGDAVENYEAFANESTVGTLALLDLDHDGVLDPLLVRIGREGGVFLAHWTLYRVGPRGVVVIAQHEGAMERRNEQPYAENGIFIVRLSLEGDEEHATAYQLRCLGFDGFSECPAARALRRREDAIAAAQRLTTPDDLAFDRLELDDTLAAVGMPFLLRGPYLALAPEPSPQARTDHAERAIHGARGRFTVPERKAAMNAIAERVSRAVHTRLGDTPCGPVTAKEERAVTRALETAAISRQDDEVDGPLVPRFLDGCVGPNGAHVLVGLTSAIKDSPRTYERTVLLFVAPSGQITPIVRGLTSFEPGETRTPSLEVELRLNAGMLLALVRDDDGLTAAIADERVTEKRAGLELSVPWTEGIWAWDFRGAGLAREGKQEPFSYWRATPTGFARTDAP